MTTAAVLPDEARAVLTYWFGDETEAANGQPRDLWFRKSTATDAEIAQRFGAVIERALRGEFAGWAARPAGALAEIVLLDQFTRNVFRDTAHAFAGDPQALRAAQALLATRADLALPPAQRAFAYLPFEHAESMPWQDRAVQLFTALADDAPQLAGMLDYAKKHREVVQRFGRFPHRNAALGRQSTPEESQFLREPDSRF